MKPRRLVIAVFVALAFVGGTVAARPAPFRHQAAIGFSVYVGDVPIEGVSISYVLDTHNPTTCLAIVAWDDKIAASPAAPESCQVPVDTQ